jgi:cell division protein FtsI/penicillin-binding protein 2
LSIDLELQRQANTLLGAQKGALVLLNANTGEVLVMASHPTFNANLLDEIGPALQTDSDAPLLNRASQGQYAPGTSLAPFLLAEFFENNLNLPESPPALLYQHEDRLIRCTLRPEQPATWQNVLQAGCPNPLISLGNALGTQATIDLMKKLSMTISDSQLDSLALGQNQTITPLNMARLAAAISNQGTMPPTQLALAVNTPAQGWVSLPPQAQPQPIFSASASAQAAQLLQVSQKSYWESMGQFKSHSGSLVWYLGGTLPNWQGAPLAIAIVIEDDQPELAQKTGREILESAIGP